MKKILLFSVLIALPIFGQNRVLRDLSCSPVTASGTTYACSPPVDPGAYRSGELYAFKADVANTGAATINLTSHGAKTMRKWVSGSLIDLVANDIGAGQWVVMRYDGTYMQVLSLGGATIPSVTGALKGNGSGGAAAVTGAGTNCVKVDGTSSACAGGSGAGMFAQLTDFTATDTTGTIQTIGALCSAMTPCQTRTGSSGFFTMTAPATITLSGSSSSGTVFTYVSSLQVLSVGHSSAATLTCSGCTVVPGITAFPPDSIPLLQTTFVANVWDVITPAMDKRPSLSNSVTAAGSGVSSAYDPVSGIQTLSTDPTLTPRYFSGFGVPGALTCAAGRDFYTDKTNLHVYFCPTANTWVQADGAISTYGKTILASDQTFTSTTTLANLTGLTYSLAASTQYAFECWAVGTAGATSGGYALAPAYSGTITTGLYWESYQWLGPLNAPGVGGTIGANTWTTFGNNGAPDDRSSTSAVSYIVRGSLTTNSSGTFTLQAAQFASNANASTIKAGSTCTLTKP